MVGMSGAVRYILRCPKIDSCVVQKINKNEVLLMGSRRFEKNLKRNRTVGDFRRFACQGPKAVCCWRRLVFGLKKIYTEKTKSSCCWRFEKMYKKSSSERCSLTFAGTVWVSVACLIWSDAVWGAIAFWEAMAVVSVGLTVAVTVVRELFQ